MLPLAAVLRQYRMHTVTSFGNRKLKKGTTVCTLHNIVSLKRAKEQNIFMQMFVKSNQNVAEKSIQGVNLQKNLLFQHNDFAQLLKLEL